MCARSQLKLDELMRLVHPSDGHPEVFAMIDAYLDESGIHAGATVCVIAGYFGGPGQMRKLERSWSRALREFSFEMADFHAKEPLKYSPVHSPCD